MHHYDKSKQSTYKKYHNFNNQYGWCLSQKLPCDGREYVKDISMFANDSIQNFTKNSDISYALIIVIVCSEYLHSLHRFAIFT